MVLQDYCSGFSIGAILNEDVNWTCEMTVGFLVHQLLLCLEHLHSLGIAHKHIDLEHLICNTINPNFKDSEFKLLGVEMPCIATEGDMFLAPEVFLGELGPKQDVFALGILVYKVVSNNYPIEEQETLSSYRKSQIDELSSIVSNGG